MFQKLEPSYVPSKQSAASCDYEDIWQFNWVPDIITDLIVCEPYYYHYLQGGSEIFGTLSKLHHCIKNHIFY